MKNALANRIFRRVSIVHGTVILLTVLLPLARCARKPKEVVTFVDLAGAPAPAFEPEPEEKPEIEEKPKPEPKPEPVPEKKPQPKPASTNTPPKKAETNLPPKKVETKKTAVTNTPPKKAETKAPAKPKTEAERLAEIRKGGRKVVNPSAAAAAARRTPDLSGIRAALNSAATGSGGTASSGSGSGSGGGMYDPFAGYYDSVKQRIYAVWRQPAGAPIGLTATATIRVERNGAVSVKSITRRSGNPQFDQSVQSALNATVQLPIPPADLPDRNITVEFVLSD